jgi:hypothetical protein
MADQLNIFLDNQPGRLNTVTGVLAEQRINIRAMVIADRKDFGVAKLLVDRPHDAHKALVGKGFAAALRTVLAVVIPDAPGGLHQLLELLAKNGINILDAYGFVVESTKRAVWCVEVENPKSVSAVLDAHGIKQLTDSELYQI